MAIGCGRAGGLAGRSNEKTATGWSPRAASAERTPFVSSVSLSASSGRPLARAKRSTAASTVSPFMSGSGMRWPASITSTSAAGASPASTSLLRTSADAAATVSGEERPPSSAASAATTLVMLSPSKRRTSRPPSASTVATSIGKSRWRWSPRPMAFSTARASSAGASGLRERKNAAVACITVSPAKTGTDTAAASPSMFSGTSAIGRYPDATSCERSAPASSA
mmetsp:Transcript_23745/g.77205  ORF Transcript_23745/g.77205 Transcript_23745/m.77205 type:complete len:224 (+) Transcript_23745:1952-2623(+)